MATTSRGIPYRSGVSTSKTNARASTNMKARLRLLWRVDVLLGMLLGAGWLSVVFGVAQLITVWAWPIGIGILLLGCVGWKTTFIVLYYGPYALSQQQKSREDEE